MLIEYTMINMLLKKFIHYIKVLISDLYIIVMLNTIYNISQDCVMYTRIMYK